MPNSVKLFFIYIIIAIFFLVRPFPAALSYSSPDIPVRHWSYESVEKLAICGLLGLSGLDTRPMTRVQMAYKIKEAMDNIEEENIPSYLSMDREHIEYLQLSLYRLIEEFRQELVLIGATAAHLEDQDEASATLKKFFSYNLALPIKTEHRFAGIKSQKDILLENENGLRLEEGYNLRTRFNSWLNTRPLPAKIGFTFSARPALRITDTDSELFLDEGAVKFSVLNIEASLAKSAMWWGPGYHGSMLMSNNARPLNLIRIRSIRNFALPWVFGNLGLFGADFFISRLEKDRPVPRPNLVGLRLELAPLPYFRLGANRIAIMGGKGRPKLRWEDYWKIFVARGKDEFSPGEIKRTDTDQLASFDARFVIPLRPEVKFASGIEAYGEWAGEDRFSFWENESPGFLIGLFLTDILRDKGTDFRIEYAENKPAWYDHGLYNVSGVGSAYTYKGGTIGHHMGGDSNDIFFRVSKELAFLSTPYFDSVKGGFQLDIERHRLSTAVQEKKIETAVDILWTHSHNTTFSLRYELEDYRNLNYASGQDVRNHIFLAEAEIRF